jgi:hypothetical protein
MLGLRHFTTVFLQLPTHANTGHDHEHEHGFPEDQEIPSIHVAASAALFRARPIIRETDKLRGSLMVAILIRKMRL